LQHKPSKWFELIWNKIMPEKYVVNYIPAAPVVEVKEPVEQQTA
jgi:hypothetical protein